MGKLTVGTALSELTAFKLFHNHLTVNLVTSVLPAVSGDPALRKLVAERTAELTGVPFTWGQVIATSTNSRARPLHRYRCTRAITSQLQVASPPSPRRWSDRIS